MKKRLGHTCKSIENEERKTSQPVGWWVIIKCNLGFVFRAIIRAADWIVVAN